MMRGVELPSSFCMEFWKFSDYDTFPQLESTNEDRIEEEIAAATESMTLDNDYNAIQAQQEQKRDCEAAENSDPNLKKFYYQVESLVDVDFLECPKLECQNEEMLETLIEAAIEDIDQWATPDPEWKKQDKETEEIEYFDFPQFRNVRGIVHGDILSKNYQKNRKHYLTLNSETNKETASLKNENEISS